MRTMHNEVPPRVEYELTPLGYESRLVLDAMAAWATTVPNPENASGENLSEER